MKARQDSNIASEKKKVYLKISLFDVIIWHKSLPTQL